MIVRVFGFLKLVFIILVPIIQVIHCKAIDTADASNIPEFELILAQLVSDYNIMNMEKIFGYQSSAFHAVSMKLK